MKLSKIIYGLFLMLAGSLLIFACKQEEEIFPTVSSPKTVAEIAADNGELSVLTEALNRVNLDSVLSTGSTFTLFAPDNDAFSGIDLASLSDATLSNVLLNHVRSTISAEFVESMSTGYTLSMAVGPDDLNLSIFTNVTDSRVVVNGDTIDVDMRNLGGTNGVVHVMEGVLLPPTVVSHISYNPDFSILNQAIARAGLSDALSSGEDVFTVVAPNNGAFEKFLMDVNGAFGWSTINDVPAEVLEEVLLYHVFSGGNVVAGDINDTEQTTLQGGTINISNNEIDDPTELNASIVLTDVQAINGVVHGIDKVLLPESVHQSILSATLSITERLDNRGYSELARAVELTGLTDNLSSDQLTLFAPNNEAFTALFALTENFSSLDDFNTPQGLVVLEELLNYHLSAGVLMASGLVDGNNITSLTGEDILINLGGDEPRLIPTLEGAIPSRIVSSNIGASNGVLHEINRVLIPQSLAGPLGIDTGGGTAVHPITKPELVFFDWDGKDQWWGDVTAENEASISLDGSNYGRINMQTGGTGWLALFFRNSSSLNGADAIGANINDYTLKFDINVFEPINDGVFKIRFKDDDGVDAFYDWAPWRDTGEAFDTDGWLTVEIPLSVLGQPDFSLVDSDFGMAFQDADVLLNFAIDNVRFDSPGSGGVDEVDDPNLVFFDWDGKDQWWGDVIAENDASITLDGSNYGRINKQTGGTGWLALFFRNSGSLNGGDVVGAGIDNYVLKFEINVLEPINSGAFKIRFKDDDGVDAFYDWAPWNDTGEPYETNGWETVSIPLSVLGQPDFSLVDSDFGMAFQDADILLNFAIDNVRFETK